MGIWRTLFLASTPHSLVFPETTAFETPSTFLTLSCLLRSWLFFHLLLKGWGSLRWVCVLSNAVLPQQTFLFKSNKI